VEQNQEKLRLLVVEPDFLVRKGISSILDSIPEFRVAGEAATAKEALELFKKYEFDCVLTELWQENPDKSLLAKLREHNINVPVVVLTASRAVQSLFDAMRLGAQGYLLKSLSPEVWKQVILSAVNKDRPFAAKVACDILRELAPQPEERDKAPEEEVASVTAREKEILILLAQGLSNKEIGDKLAISPNTVKNHLQRLQNKLGVENRTQMISYAIKKYL
jgi:DNA-binding NarL/FixJ family response regulator